MTRRFKKGDTVTLVGLYNGLDSVNPDMPLTIMARRMIVTSWGKIQATLIDADTGDRLRCRIGANDAGIIAGHKIEDASAIAADLVESELAAKRSVIAAWLRRDLGFYERKTVDAWQAAVDLVAAGHWRLIDYANR